MCRSLPGCTVCVLLLAAAMYGALGCASPGYRIGHQGGAANRRNAEDSIHTVRTDYSWGEGNPVTGAGFAERHDASWHGDQAGETSSRHRYERDKYSNTKRYLTENDDGSDVTDKRDDPRRNQGIRKKKHGSGCVGASRNNIAIYRVQKGDTLTKISRRFGCSVSVLARLNNIGSRGTIRAGMALRIPGSGTKGCGKETREMQQAIGNDVEFIWPLRKVLRVERDAGAWARNGGVMIKGAAGDAVLSAADGEVKKIGEMRGYGTYVILSHEGRYVSIYARVKDVRVREGDKVASGRSIARVSSDDGTIIFEIGRSGRPVDPLRFLPRKSGLAPSSY